MAAPDTSSIIRVPGTLTWNGTTIGETRDQEFIIDPQYFDVWAEEFGAVVDRFYCGEKAIFKCVLRYPDADAISAAMPYSPGGGDFLFRPGGTTSNTRAGTSLYTAKAGALIFVPKASAHPSLTMYNALPCPDASARLQLSLKAEYGLALVFVGTQNSSGQVYAWS